MTRNFRHAMVLAAGCALVTLPTAAIANDPCRHAIDERQQAYDHYFAVIRQCIKNHPNGCPVNNPRVKAAEAEWYRTIRQVKQVCG